MPATVAGVISNAWDGIVGAQQTGPRENQQFVNCTMHSDQSLYLLTTTNLTDSNPLRFVLNKDGSVSIRLQTFNSFGNIDKSYSLCFCNFNVNTYTFIEKVTNPIGTFLINMVCFDDDTKREMPNNTLNFGFEVSKYPDSYLKENNIYNLGSPGFRWQEIYIGPGTLNIAGPTGSLNDGKLGADLNGIIYTEFGFETPFINIGSQSVVLGSDAILK